MAILAEIDPASEDSTSSLARGRVFSLLNQPLDVLHEPGVDHLDVLLEPLAA
jgi:hypothetical protein